MNRDMARFASRYGVAFRVNDAFPINTLTLMRGAIGLQDDIRLPVYVDTVFSVLWIDNQNLSDPAVLEKTLFEAGFLKDEFVAPVGDAQTKQALIDATNEVVARGVFGAPSFFVGDTLFFGQDRLDFVEEALRAV